MSQTRLMLKPQLLRWRHAAQLALKDLLPSPTSQPGNAAVLLVPSPPPPADLLLLACASAHSRPIRFPVKKAQHGGRFDAVDFVPTTSSPKGKNRTRRSQQTLQDLTAMNTNDHAQRSMQRQGSIVLLQGTETKDCIAGRPVFTDNSAFSSPLASAIYMSSPYAAARHTTSSHTPSSPRDAISPLSPPPVTNLPQRPHTAHPSSSSSSSSRSRVAPHPLAVDVGDLASAVFSPSTGATAVPQPPDVGHATDSSPSRTHSQLPSQQGAASPLSSSRSKR